MKKLTAFALAMAIMMSAAGCTKKTDDKPSTPIETITVSQTVYKEERLELPADFLWSSGIVYSEEHGLRLFYTDIDQGVKMAVYDKELQLTDTLDLNMDESTAISYIAQSGDGTICALCTTTIAPDDDSIGRDENSKNFANRSITITSDDDSSDLYSKEYWEKIETTLAVRYFSFDGELISAYELGDLEGTIAGNPYISGFSECGDDYLFSIFGEAVLTDKNGKIKKRRPDNGGTYVSDKEGCIWYCHTSYMSRTETLTDPAGMIEYPEGSMMSRPPVPGDDKFPMYLMQGDGLYGMTRGGQMIKLIDYSGSLLSASDITYICPIGEEEFVISGSNSNSGSAYVSVLRARPDDYTEERQTLIVGIHNVINTGDRDMGTEFSRLNDNYTVEFREYKWDSDDLKADILSDNAPDVYEFDDISEMHRYANMGAFADMDELSAKYGGMSSSDLLPNIVEAMRYKGGLYAIPRRFQAQIYIASGEVVPKEYSDWTLDEFFEIADNMPEGMAIGDNITMRDHYAAMSFLCNIAQWVDPERGECRFDSDEFIRVLSFCKDVNYAEPYDYENDSPESGSETFHMLVNKQALLYSPSFMGSLRYFKQQTALNSMTIDEAALVNPPGSGGGSIKPERFFAVTNNGKCQQGGWEFLGYVMSYDKQMEYSPFFFPVQKEAFEQSLKDQAEEMNNEGVSIDAFNQYEYTVDPHITDEEVGYLRERLLSCSSISGGYKEISIICQEESDRFFAGECSAEECASMIQNRASIYLSENYK